MPVLGKALHEIAIAPLRYRIREQKGAKRLYELSHTDAMSSLVVDPLSILGFQGGMRVGIFDAAGIY